MREKNVRQKDEVLDGSVVSIRMCLVGQRHFWSQYQLDAQASGSPGHRELTIISNVVIGCHFFELHLFAAHLFVARLLGCRLRGDGSSSGERIVGSSLVAAEILGIHPL